MFHRIDQLTLKQSCHQLNTYQRKTESWFVYDGLKQTKMINRQTSDTYFCFCCHAVQPSQYNS